jgi:hypothetical protein
VRRGRRLRRGGDGGGEGDGDNDRDGDRCVGGGRGGRPRRSWDFIAWGRFLSPPLLSFLLVLFFFLFFYLPVSLTITVPLSLSLYALYDSSLATRH